MNIKELKDSLDFLFKAEHTPFIWGHAGIGKSTVIRQYANEKGYKFFPFYLGTQSDLGDILGLASFVKDENGSEIATTFATPLWLKETIQYCIDNPDSGAVIFLDEFNRARRDILNGMFSLALDKTFHTLKLPKNCHIVAAGNPPTDEYFVTDVDETALMARFTHIKLEPSFKEWQDYAKQQGFETTILSFLAEQPELLEDAKSDFKLPVKVDRRAYERLNRLFKVGTPENLLEKLSYGIIGVERAVAYKLHVNSSSRPLTALEVVGGVKMDIVKTWSDSSDTKVSLLSGTCDNLVDFFTANSDVSVLLDSNLECLTAFLEILPRDLSYKVLKQLHKLENPIFKAYCRNTAFEGRLTAIIKDAKGIE